MKEKKHIHKLIPLYVARFGTSNDDQWAFVEFFCHLDNCEYSEIVCHDVGEA